MSSNPELARLLASLRGELVESQSLPSSDQSNSSLPQHSKLPGLESSLPSPGRSAQQTVSRPSPASFAGSDSRQGPIPLHLEEKRPQSPALPVPDPSAIVSWSAAIKHVSRHIVPNDKAESKIKHLISEQHKHEREWWHKREEIVQRQTGRVDNQQKAADLLKLLGGHNVPIAPSDPKADQAELEAYDKKVYRSMTFMTQHFDRELRQLGVPFFAIRHDLVILEEGKQKEGSQKGRLDRGELRDLQRRLVEHLEAVFGDEP